MPQHPHQPYLSQDEEYLYTTLHVTKSGRLRMIMIIISAPLVCAKHSFELPLKLSMPQIRVICSPKTWLCSGVPFLNKWNHHIFFLLTRNYLSLGAPLPSLPVCYAKSSRQFILFSFCCYHTSP